MYKCKSEIMYVASTI